MGQPLGLLGPPQFPAKPIWRGWSKQATILMGQQKAMTTKVDPDLL